MCAYVSTYVCAGRVTCACEYEKPEVSTQLVFFCLSVPCSLSPPCLRNGSLNSALTLSATLAGLECPQLPPPDMLALQPDALHLTSRGCWVQTQLWLQSRYHIRWTVSQPPPPPLSYCLYLVGYGGGRISRHCFSGQPLVVLELRDLPLPSKGWVWIRVPVRLAFVYTVFQA